MIENPSNNKGVQWFTSLGTEYPSYSILGKNKTGDVQLVISGGHRQLQKQIANLVDSTPGICIEDVTDRRNSYDSSTTICDTIKIVKQLQGLNHSVMASRVITALNNGPVKVDACTGVTAPVKCPYSCFYNTIHEVPGSNGTFAITQGVVDTGLDLSTDQGNTPTLYMIESPQKYHRLTIERNFSNVRYFPITTGSCQFDIGMNEKDSQDIYSNTHVTGISSLHNLVRTSFQPYDGNWKESISPVFGRTGYAIVGSDEPFNAILSSTSGMDPRVHTIADYLALTKNMSDDAMIRAPVNSSPVQLIFNTFPGVLDTLKDNGISNVSLAEILRTDGESPHYSNFKIGALRIANEISQNKKETSTLEYGMKKIVLN